MNGYKIVLLKAILCFIGCRKVNGYAPEYVLFIYIAEKAIKSAARSLKFIGTTKVEKKEPTQTYYFKHADGEEKMTLEVLHLGNGWVSLGKYHFTAGHTSLILTDEGADQYQKIFADAVKWVKYTK